VFVYVSWFCDRAVCECAVCALFRVFCCFYRRGSWTVLREPV